VLKEHFVQGALRLRFASLVLLVIWITRFIGFVGFISSIGFRNPYPIRLTPLLIVSF